MNVRVGGIVGVEVFVGRGVGVSVNVGVSVKGTVGVFVTFGVKDGVIVGGVIVPVGVNVDGVIVPVGVKVGVGPEGIGVGDSHSTGVDGGTQPQGPLIPGGQGTISFACMVGAEEFPKLLLVGKAVLLHPTSPVITPKKVNPKKSKIQFCQFKVFISPPE